MFREQIPSANAPVMQRIHARIMVESSWGRRASTSQWHGPLLFTSPPKIFKFGVSHALAWRVAAQQLLNRTPNESKNVQNTPNPLPLQQTTDYLSPPKGEGLDLAISHRHRGAAGI